MTRARFSLRARLLLAFLAVALGTLGLSIVLTYALVSRSVEEAALDDMRDRTQALASSFEDVRVQPDNPETARNELQDSMQRARSIMNLTDVSFVLIAPDGTFVQPQSPAVAELFRLPDGLVIEDIDAQQLMAGKEVSGRKGDLMYVARVLNANDPGRTTVVVATDTVDTQVLRRARPLMLVAALTVFLVVVLVSAWLTRRLTRPIGNIEAAAQRIAAGDLSARAGVPRGTDEELVALAETLNTMAAQLEQARGSERAFLLSVSHDLRTPLTSIRGYADALADGVIDGADEEARRRAAEVISAEARRLERLVKDLLDLSRLDTRQFSLNPTPTDVTAVIRDAAEAFVPAARDLGVALAVTAEESLAADTDPERLAQIVANLVENALKYARTSVRVDTSANGAGHFVLTVTDDGPGIPAAELPRVFERLYTVRDAPGRSVGTGLGLAIVHELTSRMGGNARVELAPDGGTRFVVSLPLG